LVTANAASRLIQHYVDNFRRLAWRSPPGAPPPDPYLVWLSEIMLQQTTVATVAPRFDRFVQRWPTVEALAAAPDAEVLTEWAGLGYYARARNLIACAREVAARGAFPITAAKLSELPGIGRYTAAAIAAIAFGEKAPAVDTNVKRVIARLHAMTGPAAGETESRVLDLMQEHRPGDVIQALMDLGATVCRPRKPRCEICPFKSDCRAFAVGDPENYPTRSERKPRPHRHGTAWWIERNHCVWLVRRPASGLLGGMAALPGTDWVEAPYPPRNRLDSVRHIFTHFSLELSVEVRAEPSGEGWWHPIERLDRAGLPTLYRRAVDIGLASRARAAAAA
jgi:A/G-specific adenine glycosylase